MKPQTPVSISQRDNFAGKFGFVYRSSAIFYYKLTQDEKTTISFMDYWGPKRNLEVYVIASLRDILGNSFSKKIIGFDTFDQFPETAFEDDIPKRRRLIEASGGTSISVDQLQQTLENKNCHQNIELVPGDICNAAPEYVAGHPELKISLLNRDTDIYEPAVIILEHLYPRIVKGGILIIDDYGTFPEETKAIDEYMSARNPNVKIRKFPFCMTPCYVVVE